MTIRFSNALVAEAIQPFWAALQAGEFLTEASALAGTHRHRGLAWLREAGSVRPRRGRDLRGRCPSFSEREEIALGRAGGEKIRAIAAALGRSPSTVSRELTRNADRSGATALRRRTRSPTRARVAQSRRSWRRTWCCARRSSRICRSATHPSRSPGGGAVSSPTTRRCGCRPRRSTNRCMCKHAARCAVTWRAVCAPGARSAVPPGSGCGSCAARPVPVFTTAAVALALSIQATVAVRDSRENFRWRRWRRRRSAFAA